MKINFRPMRASDRASVLALCAQIWEGHDYIPQVFDDWLAHSQGQFTALLDAANNDLVALGKLTHLTDADWWLEGLRVAPQAQGKGVGRQLHQYHVDLWQQFSAPHAALRLLTDHDNAIVQHLCTHSGFTLVGEVKPYRAVAQAGRHQFRRLAPTAAANFFQLTTQAHTYHTHQKLYQAQTLWRWAEMTPHTLAAQEAWVWRDGAGIILVERYDTTVDNVLNTPCLYVDFWGVPAPDLGSCLSEARALAHELNFETVGTGALMSDTILLNALTTAGYVCAWAEDSLCLYEKRKP